MPKQAALSAENQETWTQPTKRPAKWVADGQSFPDTDEDDVISETSLIVEENQSLEKLFERTNSAKRKSCRYIEHPIAISLHHEYALHRYPALDTVSPGECSALDAVAEDYFLSPVCLEQFRSEVNQQLALFNTQDGAAQKRSVVCLRWFPRASLGLQRALVSALCRDLDLHYLDLGQAALARPGVALQNDVCSYGQSDDVKAVVVFTRLQRVLSARSAAEVVFLSTLFQRCLKLGNHVKVIFVTSFESTAADPMSAKTARKAGPAKQQQSRPCVAPRDANDFHLCVGSKAPSSVTGRKRRQCTPSSTDLGSHLNADLWQPCNLSPRDEAARCAREAAFAPNSAPIAQSGKRREAVAVVRSHAQFLLHKRNTKVVKVEFRFRQQCAGLRRQVLHDRMKQDAVGTRARDHAECVATALDSRHTINLFKSQQANLFHFFLLDHLNALPLRRADYAKIVDIAVEKMDPAVIVAAQGADLDCELTQVKECQARVVKAIKTVLLAHSASSGPGVSKFAVGPQVGSKLETGKLRQTATHTTSARAYFMQQQQQVVKQQQQQKASRAGHHHAAQISQCIVKPDQISVTFDDIGGLVEAKTQLLENIVIPHRCPHLFDGILQDVSKGVLLYGPPGTGKTMLAKAVARESGATFINVSAAAVHSKWAGDSEKAISALFAIARKNSPCVIFIDEVDSLLRARGGVSGDGSGAGSSFDRKIVNMFLQEWDGLCSKLNREARVTVLGATNRPHDLDEAVLRRFEVRCLVDIADPEANEDILRCALQNDTLQQDENADNVDIAKIARICHSRGYSASDVVALCRQAAWVRVREAISNAAKSSKSKRMRVEANDKKTKSARSKSRLAALMAVARSSGGASKCAPKVGRSDCTAAPLQNTQKLRPICGRDFEVTFAASSKHGSASASSREAVLQWHETYGTCGADFKSSRSGLLGNTAVAQMYS